MDFAHTRHLHGLPHARRARIREHEDAYDECERRRNWTDNSPIPGCSRNTIACDACLIERHVNKTLQDDPWCPRSFNGQSSENCFWGLERYSGLCEDCGIEEEFGCGWGEHNCTHCAYDKHHCEEIVVRCIDCGPCENPACDRVNFHCTGNCSMIVG
jgi:hypothetical protein